MLSTADLDRFATAADADLRLTLHPGEDSELAGALEATARQVAAAGVGIAVDAGDGEGITPALGVVFGGRENARWSAVPDGPEAPPFVDHIAALLEGTPPPDWAAKLAGVGDATELLVFVAPTCPHCPLAVRVALAAARACDAVRVGIVDVQRHESLAQRFKVTAVPLTLLDGGVALAGVPKGADLVAHIVARGSSVYGERLFRSLVENGRLEEAAAAAADAPARFLSAWASSTTALRMGLLLVAEQLLERTPRVLDDIVPGLADLAGAEDAALRGDSAGLLGQIGDARARPALEILASDENPDVAEIASDALDELSDQS